MHLLLVAVEVALLAGVLGWPGWRILSLLGVKNLGPELTASAAVAVGVAVVSLAAWLGYLTRTGLYAASVIFAVGLATLVVLDGRRRLPALIMPMKAAHTRWSTALVALVAVLTAYSGPWLSRTADTFYHLAAARELLRANRSLPQDIFLTDQVAYPDTTSGSLHLALAWLSLPAGMFTAFDALTLFGAMFTIVAFIALVFELTSSRLAAILGGGLYVFYHFHFDFRIAGYPNQISPGLAWISIVFLVRFARSSDPKRWRDLALAAFLLFGAGAVHPGIPPYAIVLLAASLAAAIPVALIRRRWAPLTNMFIGAGVLMLADLPMLAARLLGLPPPGPLGSYATDPPLLGVITTPFGFHAIDLHFWFDQPLSIPVLATILLLGKPLRALWSGEPAAAVVWGGSLITPIAVFVPFIVDRPQDFYYLARISELLAPYLYVVLAWTLADALVSLRTFTRQGGTRGSPALVPAASAALILLMAAASLSDARLAAASYKPGGARSVELSRQGDLRYAWADRIQALDRAGPGVVLADLDVAYELAGLTGRQVAAVWTSHFPFAAEAMDGAMRRGDVLEALSPHEDLFQLASILERYQVAYVMLDRDLDTDAMWQAAAQNPLYQRVGGGPTWALYRYARENLDQALGIALSSNIGVAPAQVVAGRYFFIRIASCCSSGAAIHVTARGALHGAVIDVTVGAPTSKTGNGTVPVAVPDSTPPDRYDVSVSVSGSSPVDAGVIAVGREYEAEYFAGVFQERDLDKNAWHQWVSIHAPAYSRGLASYTNTLNVAATRPIDLPAGSYCMSVTVYDAGDGSERDLAVEVAGGTVTYTWGGGPAGMREIAEMVTVPGGSSQLAYRAVAPSQLPLIVDRIVFYPTSLAAGAAAC